jgi:NAD-dependent dihydropyrimidine dehydrogenase PreA subunit
VTYVITSNCVDIKDMSCIEECPVDCIYEGDRKLYIHPKECIDCGACEPVCPVDAIYPDRTLPSEDVVDKDDNKAFFYDVLPGRGEPLGAPGGYLKIGPLDVDTPHTAELPPNPDAD